MKYICKYCNYETNNKFNYNRHTESLKHHKNKKKKDKSPKNRTNVLEIRTNVLENRTNVLKNEQENIKYECKFCNYVSYFKKDYIKHCNTKNHKNIKKINELCNEKLQENNNIIDLYKNKLLEKEDLLSEKDQYIEQLEFKIEVLNEIKNITKKSHRSAMQIIVNNYNNAPNLESLPAEHMTDAQFKSYIQLGIPDGVIKMVKDYYVDNIPKEQRSLWCLDQARLKYLIRYDNDWKVDIMGKILKKKIIPPITKRLTKYCTEANIRDHELYCCFKKDSEMGEDKKQNQIIREMSNMFLMK